MNLVLSLFPGADLLGYAFEQEGYCVVTGPDVLFGRDIKRFHPPRFPELPYHIELILPCERVHAARVQPGWYEGSLRAPVAAATEGVKAGSTDAVAAFRGYAAGVCGVR